MKTFDIIIAGGGIIGLAAAWQLARRSSLNIAVLEKGASVGEGSTGASSAVCRHRYSSDQMVSLARDGIRAYRHWAHFTGIKQPAARFHPEGMLWMPGDDLNWSDREHARLAGLGVPTEIVDDEAMARRFPALRTCTLPVDRETGASHECRGGGRNLFETQGGYMEPVAAAQDLLQACRAAGVTVLFRHKVIDVLTAAGAVKGVALADGSRLAAPLLLNATGPWCLPLFAAAGLALQWELVPVRIQVLYRDRPADVAGHIPVVADIQGGIYFRTQNQGQQIVVGSVLEADEREQVADPDNFQTLHDDAFQHAKLHLLHHRVPGLPYHGTVRGYCGLYTVNKVDMHPIVGPTDIEGLWAANGFSGHGFKLAPAIGSMLAQAITGDTLDFDTSVPLSFLAMDRSPITIDARNVLA